MRVAVLSVMLGLALAGCADPDPVESRLRAGAPAILVAGEPAVVSLLPLVGSRVQVESDGEDSISLSGPDLRPVRCLFLDGPAAGTIRDDIPRMCLRPITPR